MPSSRYSIVEPHPSATSSSYIATGRGGAGNIKRAPPSVTRGFDASGPASISSSLHSQNTKRVFLSGRGGAGNVHQPSERAIFSFDEELAVQMARERSAAPVYHVGRGGAGNVYGKDVRDAREERYLSRKVSGDSDSARSESSVRSAESGAEVATRGILKGWKKITGVH